jgi:hypothetical protein
VITHQVSYTQGNIYYNRYYDGLVNKDTPSFPVLSNQNVACASGTCRIKGQCAQVPDLISSSSMGVHDFQA